MTERTYNIIRCCKATLHHEIPNRIERVKAYLAEETGCVDYADYEIENIIKTAVYDYIDTCDKPSAFLRAIDEMTGTYAEKATVAFALVRVRDHYGTAINGFARFIN